MSSCTSATKGRGSPRPSCRARSSASRAPTRRARAAAPAWASPSPPRWPAPTAAAPTPRTATGAPTSGSRSRPTRLSSPAHPLRTASGPMRVLVVEDEIKMASLIRRGLRSEGLAADVAIKGEDALWMAGSTGYDAIVLDVMLPGIDGFETCRRRREDGIWSPVIMLTARDSVEDRVAGLDGGADDYLPKPFSFAELLARLRALARRGPGDPLLCPRAAAPPAAPAPPGPGRAPAGARGRDAEARPGLAPGVPR